MRRKALRCLSRKALGKEVFCLTGDLKPHQNRRLENASSSAFVFFQGIRIEYSYFVLVCSSSPLSSSK